MEVTLRLAEDPRAIVVPTTAVQNGQQGQFVFVVNKDSTVAVRPVTVSRTRGEDAIVAPACSPGTRSVTDGQLRLLPGSRISVKTGRPGREMNFSTLFVRRPVATTLIQLAIVIFGIMGYRALPVSDLPPIDYPTISVNASLPGANPDTLAAPSPRRSKSSSRRYPA